MSGRSIDGAFDAFVRSLDAPMVIVTTAVGEERSGCLVGFHVQCSIEPRRYAVWLSKANHTVRVAQQAEHVAVHLLARSDRELAVLFGTETGDEVDKFQHCDWSDDPHGVPLLDACPRWVVLRRTGMFDDGSDHLCFTGEPVAAGESTSFEPLRLRDVEDLEPGHEATDHPDPG